MKKIIIKFKKLFLLNILLVIYIRKRTYNIHKKIDINIKNKLKDRILELDLFPKIKEWHSYFCGPVSFQMVYYFFTSPVKGKDNKYSKKEEIKFAASMFAIPYIGVLPYMIVLGSKFYQKKMGYKSKIRHNVSYEELLYELKNNRPVIVTYMRKFDPQKPNLDLAELRKDKKISYYPHYSIVTEINETDETIKLVDPATGRERERNLYRFWNEFNLHPKYLNTILSLGVITGLFKPRTAIVFRPLRN